MDLVIREMNAQDLSRGFLEALASLAEVNLTAEQALAVFRTRLRLGVRTFVAELDGRVVGTASLLLEPKFIHAGGRVAHVEDVSVQRELQRQGIGTALLEHLIGEARRQGCYKVILNCQPPLAAFYTRLGFREHDRGLRLDL